MPLSKDFGTAVTAVEMALKAFQLDGQINVKMDSEARSIVLDDEVSIVHGSHPDFGERQVWDVEDIMEGEIVATDDVVEAVVEAVAFLIAKQAREFMYSIFEAVEDEDALDD